MWLGGSAREQFFQRGVDEGDIGAGATGVASEMSPVALADAQLGVRHMGDLELAVLGGEIEIGRGGHDDGLGFDACEGLLEVAAVFGVSGDVSVLPSPQQRQKAIGILRQKESLPEIDQEILK